MQFFLGTHKPVWLTRTDVPLFVSRRTLAEYKILPKARGPWALDSGGFSELGLNGRWTVEAADYAMEVRRYRDQIGGLQWAAPMDWMCEPFMLAKTGLTVREHQYRTVSNYLRLKLIAPDLPWVPVLQGWEPEDYLRHVEEYQAVGVDLAALPVVGVGSVCRRQDTEEALDILRPLHALGLKLHGFGFKVDGLWRGAAYLLESADSLAWSDGARREWAIMPGCQHGKFTYRKRLGREEWGCCGNCIHYALDWRGKVLAAVARGETNYQTVLL